MADKTYKLDFAMSDGTTKSVRFTAPQGPAGAAGATGPRGAQGAAGAAGPAGADGKSAYQYAQDGGYSGTEAEFAAKLASEHAAASDTTPKAAGTAAAGTEDAFARGDHVHPAQTSVTGNAGTATKLATARTIRTNLASTAAASFNGSANVTPGVTGMLPVANGGTGGSTASSAANNLKVFSLGPAVSIPSNSDLNDYVTVGNYCVASGAVAQTLTNTPITSRGYRLAVHNCYGGSSAAAYGTQIVDTYTGEVYVRYTNGSGAWSDWTQRKFTDTTYGAATTVLTGLMASTDKAALERLKVHNHAGEAVWPSCVELTPDASAGHGGYIDFHYNASTGDYTTRLLESPGGTLLLNGSEILTRAHIVDVYNASVTFTNGVAQYSNAAITATSVCMVQRRGNMADANLSFCTQSAAGSVTICTDSSVNGVIALNLTISNL